MKTTILTAVILLVMGALSQAEAFDLKAGFEAVQVRDKSFDAFEHGLSNAWHVGDYSGFDTLRLEAALDLWKDIDVFAGVRVGEESGDLENVAAELWLLEPLAGVRRRYELHKNIEAFGQATLSVPYMRMVVDAPQAEKYWAVFPVLTPAVGVTIFPYDERGKRSIGFTADIGYGTPAPLSFSSHQGVTPGKLNYSGVTYGVFVTWRGVGDAAPESNKTAEAVETKPIEPKAMLEKISAAPVGPHEAPEPVTNVPEVPRTFDTTP